MTSSEVPICQARANVMTYDDVNKKWVPSGQSPGLSKVQIYQHMVNNTFRVVGRKLQDHEVVINCAILKNLKYNQATPTFHQWRDNRHVYGLNFATKEDAMSFSGAMLSALDLLSGGPMRAVQPPPPPSVAPPTQPPYVHQPPIEQNGPQTNDAIDSRPRQEPTVQQQIGHRRYPSGGRSSDFLYTQMGHYSRYPSDSSDLLHTLMRHHSYRYYCGNRNEEKSSVVHPVLL